MIPSLAVRRKKGRKGRKDMGRQVGSSLREIQNARVSRLTSLGLFRGGSSSPLSHFLQASPKAKDGRAWGARRIAQGS